MARKIREAVMIAAGAVAIVSLVSEGPLPAPAFALAQPGGLTENVVKAYVNRGVQRQLNGTITSPLSVDVTWESVRMGQPRRPNAQDQIDGVRGEWVYPVQVKYSETARWRSGNPRVTNWHYRYNFYRNEFGDWDAVGLGPVR